mmetsp:Transcript_36956/g.85238  ORF Transcript_36956/g.85238 Transcript_36956/m.85238 type:complete len:356 (+) Transcript_36956:73-1140(+)
MPSAPRKSLAAPAVDERPSKVPKVQAAFGVLQDYPPSAKQMLLAGLLHAEGATHPWQAEVFDMADEALAKGRAQAEEKQAECKEAITKVEEKIATQEQTCNAVTEEISAASKQCGARAEELESMRAKITRAQMEVEGAKKESLRLWPTLNKIVKEEEDMQVWKEKDIGGNALSEEDIGTFQAYLTKQKVEPALVASAYNALVKKPEDRGIFDGVTVKATLEYLDEKSAALALRHSESGAANEDAQAILKGAQAMLAVADEKEVNGQVAESEAKEILAGLEAKLKEERRTAGKMSKELLTANEACTAAEEEVQLYGSAITELSEFRQGAEPESKAPPQAVERCNMLDVPTPMVAAM